MTVVAAAVRGGKACIGCDSQVSGSGLKGTTVGSKVVPVGPEGQPFGYVGIAGEAESLKWLRETPQPDSVSDWGDYLDALSNVLKEHAHPLFGSGTIYMAVTAKGIHTVVSDGVFEQSGSGKTQVHAIGSGGHVAVGSMAAEAQGLIQPSLDKMVRRAVQVACDRAEGCGEPIHIFNL